MVWRQISSKVNKTHSFPDGFSSKAWLTDYNYPKYIISVIAAGAWFIWKTCCDAIFKNTLPNYPAIICRTLAHTNEFSQINMDH